MSETRPAHIVQLILSNVRIIPIAIPSAEHIATHAIVQAPCKVMAFIAVENAKTWPAPTSTQNICRQLLEIMMGGVHYPVHASKQLLSKSTKHDISRIRNRIDFWMSSFEGSNHRVEIGSNESGRENADDAGNHPNGMKRVW